MSDYVLTLEHIIAMLASACRRNIRWPLLSLTRRLTTSQSGSPDQTQPLPDEAFTEPAEVEGQIQRRWKDPGDRSVFLFPGQGSQSVGMGRGLLKYPNVKNMFSVAQKILGYDLLTLCLEGPEEELMKTVHCQPAVFVTSLAAVERLSFENPKVTTNMQYINSGPSSLAGVTFRDRPR